MELFDHGLMAVERKVSVAAPKKYPDEAGVGILAQATGLSR
jgi:hypothetical protein